MENWIDRLAERLEEEPLTESEVTALLDLARDVTHSVEPRVTPLSMFLLGTRVGRTMGWSDEEIWRLPEGSCLEAERKTLRQECIDAQGGWLREVLPEAPPDA